MADLTNRQKFQEADNGSGQEEIIKPYALQRCANATENRTNSEQKQARTIIWENEIHVVGIYCT